MGQPAARIGDSVVDGVIVSGEPTVLIGGTPDGVACKSCALAAAKGAPVNTMYGFKFLGEAPDFGLPAPSSFGWSRYYSSAIGWVGLLGAGWRTALDLCIDADSNAIRLRDLQGRTLTFGPLQPGQQRFSVSEGVWILRGGPELALGRPDSAANQALDPAWNGLPEPWRSHPDCLCTTSGDGYYLIFAATPLLAASALREADGALPSLASTTSTPASSPANTSSEQTSAVFAGRYQLIALHSADGYVTRIDWAQYPQGWFPRWIEDSAQRLYQLHYLQLAHHEVLARDPFASTWQDKTLLRLAGVRLDHDPQREGQTLSERIGAALGKGTYTRANQLQALDTLIERGGQGSFTAQNPDSNPWLVRYQYSGEGDLIAVLNQSGEALRQFDYRSHLMVRHQYLGGEDVRYTYDRLPQNPAHLTDAEHCRVIRQERADGLSYDFHYQDLDQYGPRSTRTRDSLGREERLFFEGDAGLRRVVKTEFADGRCVTQQFDPSGHPISSTDPIGRTTWFNHDAKGRLIATTDAAGRTQKIELDAKGQAVGMTSSGGQRWSVERNAQGHVIASHAPGKRTTQYRYENPLLPDRPSTIIDPAGHAKHLAYTPSGQMAAYTDCSGKTTRYHYDRQGRIDSVIDPLEQKTQAFYDAKGGITAVQFPNGSEERYEADIAGRVIRMTDLAGYDVRFDYDRYGRVTTQTAPDGSQIHYAYDVAGRLTALTNANGQSMKFVWDVMDRLVQETAFEGPVTTFAYDALGRLIERRDDEVCTRYAYNDTDQLSRRSLYTKDSSKNSRKDPNKSTFSLSTQARHIGTEQAGDEQAEAALLSAEGWHLSDTHTFSWNTQGQLIEARTAQTLCHFEYDEAGLLIGEQQSLLEQDGEADKASRFALRHHYDALGRREKTEWLDGALKGHSLQSLAYGSGHVHQLSVDGQTITDIERDDLHRPVSYTFGTLAEQRQYDALGRLSQWQLLHSQSLAANQPDLLMRRRYGYDAASLLTHIDEQHFSAGQPVHNLLARYDYDRQGRLTGWTHSRFASVTAPEDVLHQARYAFDPASNRLADVQPLPIQALAGIANHTNQASDTHNPGTATHEDWSSTVRANLYREDFDLLQAEQRSQVISDPMGPEQGAGVRYRTDSRGNVIERQTTEGTHTHLSWDGANQLIEVAHRNAQGECWQAQYVYDAFSRRVAKQRWRKDLAPTQAGSQAQPERLRFGWDGDRLAWQRDEQTKEESAWLYRPDGTGFEPLARIRTQPQDNTPAAIRQRVEVLMGGADREADADSETEDQESEDSPDMLPQAILQAMGLAKQKLHVEWFINDHLGTPRQVIDGQGKTLWQTDYSPWGERLTASKRENTYTTDQPIRFQGQFEDEESGLYYNRYRYYDPRAGRYLSKDPIGLEGGLNAKAFALNPIQSMDMLGLKVVRGGSISFRNASGNARQRAIQRDRVSKQIKLDAQTKSLGPQQGPYSIDNASSEKNIFDTISEAGVPYDYTQYCNKWVEDTKNKACNSTDEIPGKNIRWSSEFMPPYIRTSDLPAGAKCLKPYYLDQPDRVGPASTQAGWDDGAEYGEIAVKKSLAKLRKLINK